MLWLACSLPQATPGSDAGCISCWFRHSIVIPVLHLLCHCLAVTPCRDTIPMIRVRSSAKLNFTRLAIVRCENSGKGEAIRLLLLLLFSFSHINSHLFYERLFLTHTRMHSSRYQNFNYRGTGRSVIINLLQGVVFNSSY